MIKGKSAAIVLTYGYLIYEFSTKSPSVFVFLFALLFELVLFVFIYAYTFITSANKPKIAIENVFIGSVPLLLFSYGMAYLVAEETDATRYLSTPNIGFWAPVLLYKNQIVLVVAGMVISYLLETIEFRKNPERLDIITSKLIKHALLIWALFIVVAMLAMLLSSGYSSSVFIALPLSRILLESVFNRVEKKFTPNT